MEQNGHLYTEQPFDTWNELSRLVGSLAERHVFRGQANASWPLQPTLQRSAVGHDIYRLESGLLRAFRTGASRFLSPVPEPDDSLSWLALMQHYGVPTRLLDWTLSPFIAAYFAVEDAESIGSHFSIWSISLQYLQTTARTLLADKLKKPLDASVRLGDKTIFNDWLPRKVDVVAPVASPTGHDRLFYQRGLFLCPGNLENSFEQNIEAMADYRPPVEKGWFRKITIPSTQRTAALKALDTMNINRATLFPGLDGYSQHLRQRVELIRPTLGRRIEDYGRSPDLAEFELL
ncbi:MAG TPA: FRG domain-containing protein [Bryobacteraceae bacterium]|nr:FRG domain-containing protein [Bryobacteraceae bacterium]HPT26330.1 FRG domain-containing protein [Bryobacteraceae bacterium]